MRKNVLSLLVYFFTCTMVVFAQNRTITGKVTSASDGLPLPGVSVTVKSASTIGTQTDAQGNYKLSVPNTATALIFQYIGFVRSEIPISGDVVNNQLKEDQTQLSEVVVVGYGTQSKQSLTGSISTIEGSAVANQPVPSLESAIQGRAAGVFIEAQNGKLGQAIKVRIRGSSSVSAGNQPLYVIDGLPITTDDFSNNGGATNPLTDLNQNDIASIEILKDASASAIYGSRASNGVVLITTKRGKEGKTLITYNQYYGNSSPTGKREFMNAEQYVNYMREAGTNVDELEFTESRLQRYSAGNTDYQTFNINTDWQEEVYQQAPVQNYNLAFQGGTDKTIFYVSGTYNDQKGFLIGNEINQYSTRLNLENQATNWLNLGVNLSLSRTLNKRLSGDNAFSTPMQIVALSPITPVIDPRTNLVSGALDNATGNPNSNFPVYYNPILSVGNASYNSLVYRNLGNFFGQIVLLPELSFRTELGVDILNQNEDGYYGRLTSRNTGTPNGYGVNYYTQALNFNTNNFFQYTKDFNKA